MGSAEPIRSRAEGRRVDHLGADLSVLVSSDLACVAFVGRSATNDPWAVERQVRACQSVLPENAVIVAYFYEFGSGLIDPAQRGQGRAHEMVQIPVPRYEGIADLLVEAGRPDRRFDTVMCSSIDRIARSPHLAARIERRLDRAGVRVLAANEPLHCGR